MNYIAKYFKQLEFACKCGKCETFVTNDKLIKILDKIREQVKQPIVITSGYRCKAHNNAVGGSKNSSHVRGLAVDVKADNSQIRYAIMQAAIENGVKRIGIYKNFIHLDIDEEKPQKVLWRG